MPILEPIESPAIVAVVGSVNIDLVMRLPHLPAPGETVGEGSLSRQLGGKGANQAAAAARLGAKTFLIGTIGCDDDGNQARQAADRIGVDTRFLIDDQTEPTGVAVVLTEPSGENLIGVTPGANSQLRPDHVRHAIAAIDSHDGVVIANLEVPMPAVVAAAKACRDRGWRYVLNPAPARPLPDDLLNLVSVLVPNEGELDGLGKSSPGKLLEAGVAALVVTRGAQGATIMSRAKAPTELPAFSIDVVDTTGAGDAFVGTLAWALAQRRTMRDAVVLASAGGALATRGIGAQTALATSDEIYALLSYVTRCTPLPDPDS